MLWVVGTTAPATNDAFIDCVDLNHRKAANPGMNPYVFHIAGVPLFSKRWPSTLFGNTWKQACQEAKLVGRVPHDLRRSAAITMIRAGVDEQTAMDLLGHRTPSIFRRYRIVTNTERLDAIRKLDTRQKANRRQRHKNVKVRHFQLNGSWL